MYSFDIVFKKYIRTSPELQDIKSIYVSGICIMAKNSKVGDFYISKYIDNIEKQFVYCAGSHSSPILFPKTDIIIKVKGFSKYPKFNFSEITSKYKSEFIYIENIVEY